MACCAISVHVVFGMATDAKRHLDGKVRCGKRERHSGHVTMTREAGDFSDRYMSPVGKIGVIGHTVNLYPWDRLISFDVVHQLFLLFALRHRLFVTTLANQDVRDRGFFMGEHTGMAIEAGQTGIHDMLFVIILNGLCIICAFGTTGYDQYTEDREGYGVKGDMLSHGSSKGLWNFLSLGVAWSARKTKTSIEMMFYLENGYLSILFWRGPPDCEENRCLPGKGGEARE
jgi:hypothetical protein